MKYVILLSYAILLMLVLCLCSPYSYAECNSERTECTVVFGEQYGFAWGRNPTVDHVFGYRVYEAETSNGHIQGNEDQIFFNTDILRDDNVCEGTFPNGTCDSPPFVAVSEEKTVYYVVTAVDHDGFESDWSNQVIVHIEAPEGIRNFRMVGAQ